MRVPPHSDAPLRIYQIINVTYCDRVSSSLLKSQRGFPQSHSRAFVDAFLSSHLGLTYFVRNIVSFSGCALRTHISSGVGDDGISDCGLLVRLNGWRASEAGVFGWYFPGE